MNLQPTKDQHSDLPVVTCPDLATAYRLTAATVDADPYAQILRRPANGGVIMDGEIEVYTYQTHRGDYIESVRVEEILTAACAKVNADAAILEAAELISAIGANRIAIDLERIGDDDGCNRMMTLARALRKATP